MLSSTGFDLWADGCGRSVNVAEEKYAYPFARYRAILGRIYGIIRENSPEPTKASILDIGFGTAALSAKLCADGYGIAG